MTLKVESLGYLIAINASVNKMFSRK